MKTLNDYGYADNSPYWSMGMQIRHDLNHLRVDVTEEIKNQTEVQHEDITTQIETQHQDEVDNRTNQTTLVGKFIDAMRSIFNGKNDSGEEESFYKMVMRENNETQEYLASQEKIEQTATEKLADIISSLNDISSDIEKNTSGDKTNADAIKNAINNLKTITI